MSLVVLVPVLNRAHRVQPLLDSFRETTPDPYRVLFICDPSDREERAAVEAAGGEQLAIGGSYARKINSGCERTDEPLIFLAADDLRPREGWFEAAKRRIEEGAQVVGINDLIRRRQPLATHFLITRAYAKQPTIDGRRGPLYEGYVHWQTDQELIATATHRGVYAYAHDAHVEHLHVMNRKAPDDATYRKGRASSRRDRIRFQRREHLWAT